MGEAVFCHEAGIHVDGVIKDPRTYEPFPPEEVGLSRKLSWASIQDRAAVRHRLNRLGLFTEPREVDRILNDVRAAGMRLKRTVTDHELLELSRNDRDEAGESSTFRRTTV